MSLEKDIEQVKEDLFKPASDKELLNRDAEWKKSEESWINDTFWFRQLYAAFFEYTTPTDEEWVNILKKMMKILPNITIEDLRKFDFELSTYISALEEI